MVQTADPVERILARVHSSSRPQGRPFVTLTYAQSLDGSLAARRESPLVLSGSQAQEMTHRIRAAQDAILVGIGTLLADDPQLNVRLTPGADPQPVILDSRLRTPPQARIFQGTPPWIATTAAAERARSDTTGPAGSSNELSKRASILEARGARLLRLAGDEGGRVHVPALLDCLAGLGIRSLMVEGGAAVITSFLKERMVDLLILTIAPCLVGGQPAIESLVGDEASGFPRLRGFECAKQGDDLIVWGSPVWPAKV